MTSNLSRQLNKKKTEQCVYVLLEKIDVSPAFCSPRILVKTTVYYIIYGEIYIKYDMNDVKRDRDTTNARAYSIHMISIYSGDRSAVEEAKTQ